MSGGLEKNAAPGRFQYVNTPCRILSAPATHYVHPWLNLLRPKAVRLCVKFAFISEIRGLKFDVWCFPEAWILVLGSFRLCINSSLCALRYLLFESDSRHAQTASDRFYPQGERR